MATLVIHDETATGRHIDRMDLPDVPDTVTVRDIVRWRVREEVAFYNARPREVFHGLVQPSETETTVHGYRMRSPRRLDWRQQADAAEAAYGRNGFFVMVGDSEVASLDDVVDLGSDPHVRFVKLAPFVGG